MYLSAIYYCNNTKERPFALLKDFIVMERGFLRGAILSPPAQAIKVAGRRHRGLHVQLAPVCNLYQSRPMNDEKDHKAESWQ
jgi:hypothetical protein